MEKFYLEEPTMAREADVLDYMREHEAFHSNINGSGSLDRVLRGQSYEDCLERCLKMSDAAFAQSVNRCPGKTFLLIRQSDRRLVGMINVRHHLNEAMQRFGGHIGYGIRPTERRKGYNKINLYLGLIKAREEFGLDRVMIDCAADNLGSDKTIRALGGVLERCEIDPSDGEPTKVYWIDVNEAIERYRADYEDQIIV